MGPGAIRAREGPSGLWILWNNRATRTVIMGYKSGIRSAVSAQGGMSMLRLLTAVTLSTALFAARADAQDPPKEPAKKDPKPAAEAKSTVATDEEADAALAKFKKD